MRVFRLTVIVGILTLFVQCASVPLTGRKQVILLPESEMMQMSLTSYGDFLKENKLSTRTDDTRRVKEVGTRIAAAVEAYLKSQGLEKQIEGYQWEFNLVQSPEMNAWCMPGGKRRFLSGPGWLLRDRDKNHRSLCLHTLRMPIV